MGDAGSTMRVRRRRIDVLTGALLSALCAALALSIALVTWLAATMPPEMGELMR